MILADTSVWIDHFRDPDTGLNTALDAGRVLMHPLVIGELACGHIKDRREVLALLEGLPGAPYATDTEARNLIEDKSLMGRGIGFIDVHLLAATALTGDGRLWTKDKRLAGVAADLDLTYVEPLY